MAILFKIQDIEGRMHNGYIQPKTTYIDEH